jgi:hypothetical protein
MRLHRAVKQRPVARETRARYDRAQFRHWIDADRDRRDTRDEVPAAESLVKVRACDIQRGKWRSYCDGAVEVRWSQAGVGVWPQAVRQWPGRGVSLVYRR